MLLVALGYPGPLSAAEDAAAPEPGFDGQNWLAQAEGEAPSESAGVNDDGDEGDRPSEATGEAGAADDSGREASQWRFGAGLAVVNQPVEQDFEGEVPAFDLYLDYRAGTWWNLRGGLNQAHANLDGSHLSTTALYAAYSVVWSLAERWAAQGSLGAAWVMAKLEPRGAAEPSEASGAGSLLDLGIEYAAERAIYGLRYLLIQHEGSFDGVTLSTGSNQLQLTIAFPLN